MTDDELDLDVVKEKTEETTEGEEETLVVKMSDDLIAVIRELVQLSILTGTNVVDHFRAITCEIDEDTSKLVPTEDYVEAYNVMISQLVQKAEESRAELEATENAKFTASLVTDDDGQSN